MIYRVSEAIMIPSIICNSLIIIFVAGAAAWECRKAEKISIVFRYFTTLSNALCAATALAMVICTLLGEVPVVVQTLKYVGTCSVTVTFLTVMLFLGPATKDYKRLLSGANLFLHLICPVLAIVSWIAFEKHNMSFYNVVFGTLPVVLYGALYGYKVMLAPDGRKWEDFYGFNHNGKWLISVIGMICGGFLVSVILCVI